METYRTYEDWKKEGRQVMSGQRSHKRDDQDRAVFALSQTMAVGGAFAKIQSAGDIFAQEYLTQDAFRGTGRTTMQMREAPPGAMYVVPPGSLRWGRDKANSLNRNDLAITTSTMLHRKIAGLEIPVILDHALVGVLSREDLNMILAHNVKIANSREDMRQRQLATIGDSAIAGGSVKVLTPVEIMMNDPKPGTVGTVTGRIYPDPSAKRDAEHQAKPKYPPRTIFDSFGPEFKVESFFLRNRQDDVKKVSAPAWTQKVTPVNSWGRPF